MLWICMPVAGTRSQARNAWKSAISSSVASEGGTCRLRQRAHWRDEKARTVVASTSDRRHGESSSSRSFHARRSQ